MKHRVLTGVVLGLLALGTRGAVHALEAPFGPKGEIGKWLALGDIPIPAGSNNWAATMERDLLATVGGEAGVKPVGGQEVKLPEGSFVWKLAALRTPASGMRGRPGWGGLMRRPLFKAEDGREIENAAAYLYCRLIAKTARDVSFLVGSDDGLKILVNGKIVRTFVGQRSALEDWEEVRFTLNEGTNELLVRVDNYVSVGGFVGRLLARDGTVLSDVRIDLPADAKTPELPLPPAPVENSWKEQVAEIPPLDADPEQEFFGSRLTRTMALLQDGAQTRRPVRIVFYGQSITDQAWTGMLVGALRERYPNAIIEAENHALGGWFVWRLMRAMVHGTLQCRPDLVVFHAYQGTQDSWERVLSAVRRETCAEIMIRTAHWSGADWDSIKDNPKYPGPNGEETMLRQLAQKYDCELVECRRDWVAYGLQHGMTDYRENVRARKSQLVSDGIHLSRKGNILMAQMYERHFRMNFKSRSYWADRVRWYNAVQPVSDHVDNEIRYQGAGWKPVDSGGNTWIESAAKGDKLSLKFTGRRVDAVLGPRQGRAQVLIDGQSPSKLNLYYGTLPKMKAANLGRKGLPSFMRYFIGPDMLEEIWEMHVTHLSEDGKKFRFKLYGSKTGFDGEGSEAADFVSKSGRIRIYREDLDTGWAQAKEGEPPAIEPAAIYTWQILPRFKDEIRWKPTEKPPQHIPDWNFVTLADGLPDGEHELTLIPLGDGPVAIRGIEVYRPPLATP